MAFPKGHKLYGSRKGIPNKATLIEEEVEAAFRECKGRALLVEMATSGDAKREAVAWGVFGKLMRHRVIGDVEPGGTLAEILGRVQAAGKPAPPE